MSIFVKLHPIHNVSLWSSFRVLILSPRISYQLATQILSKSEIEVKLDRVWISLLDPVRQIKVDIDPSASN